MEKIIEELEIQKKKIKEIEERLNKTNEALIKTMTILERFSNRKSKSSSIDCISLSTIHE